MLFNSLEFAIFLPIVFLIYWLLCKNYKSQNLLIFISSYIFYGWWDWRFLSLIFISTIVDYHAGLKLAKTDNPRNKKLLLWVSLATNLGLLGFFKYQNFFIDNFTSAFSFFGQDIKASGLNIVLPVGISFYTLQTLSYTIDIYKGKIAPIKDFIAFASFVSFFPQLVAGPIERGKNLIPQFCSPRKFTYDQAVDGMRQILWGLFCKLVIADNCAVYVDDIYTNYLDYSGSTLLLGAVLFSFQIYGDFSGYSHIAIGTANLFGFKLMRNFAFPFFSRDTAELWRRWHISLTTWFRDYIYLPLAIRGRRGSNLIKIRNIFVVFIITGFWHGASWTYILWGGLNAIYVLPSVLFKRNRNLDIVAKGKLFPSFKELVSIILTFMLFAFASILFRSSSMAQAFDYIREIFSYSLFSLPEVKPKKLIVIITLFTLVEWVTKERLYAFANLDKIKNYFLRWSMYLVTIGLIFYFMVEQQRFIYFQF